MIIRKLHKNRRKIAIAIVAVFSMVFVCDFLCDLGIINNEMTHHKGQHSHEVHVSDGHHDHHGNSHDHGATSTPMEEPHHEEIPDEDCCEEETSKLYASLVKYEIPTFDLNKVVVLYELPFISFKALLPYKETNPYTLNSALSPPIKGLYACILFQSFLC